LRSVFALASAVLFLALSLVSAQAAPSAQRFGSFVVFPSTDYIMLDGDLNDRAVSDFRRALKARPNAKLLVLRSAGGYVDVGLDVAAMVRSRGLSTAVPSNMHCFSACTYIFFAGRDHVVTGKLGVHRVGEADGSASAGADAYYRSVKGQIQRFVPKNVIKYMESTPSTSMHVFSRKEINALSINKGGSGSFARQFASM